MRLVSLRLDGFRAFPRAQDFDLDATAIVIVGANGNGKTSLMDGVLWALTGRLPRLQSAASALVSMYSESGRASATLRMRAPGTSLEYTVTRICESESTLVALDAPTGRSEGAEAEAQLARLLWPESAPVGHPGELLANALTRNVYLQQDQVRHFVEAVDDEGRFSAVSELLGAGRLTDLQDSLERSKKAWSTSTNTGLAEIGPLRARLDLIQARVAELSSAELAQGSLSATDNEWLGWWREVHAAGITRAAPEMSSRDAAAALDGAIRELDASRRALQRHLEALRQLKSQLEILTKRAVPDLEPLRLRLTRLRERQATTANEVRELQARVAEERRRDAALQEATERLRSLARLAMTLLGDKCPVCSQNYDREMTKERLVAIVNTGPGTTVTEPVKPVLAEMIDALHRAETDVANAEVLVGTSEREAASLSSLMDGTLAELKSNGLPTEGLDQALSASSKAIDLASSKESHLVALQKRGEGLSLYVARAAATSAIQELKAQETALVSEISARSTDVERRTATGAEAQRVIEGIRAASLAFVGSRLDELGDLLQAIYSRIDPHPSFKAVSFLTQSHRGRGQLSTLVKDAIVDRASDTPALVLSSSQLNALAVAVFLTLNLGAASPPLSVAMLDDPLQSLDDINLLGLVDLLRQTKDQRQLIVSTHDRDFGALLARKLRPKDAAERAITVELSQWSRSGPEVSMREVHPDPAPRRLATAG